jgi:dipeptidyl aminopeptidase/acylaminoacyl peptidase
MTYRSVQKKREMQRGPELRLILTLLVVAFLLFPVANGYGNEADEQNVPKQEKKKQEYKWSVDDLLTTDSVTEYHISPSGKQMVWTVRKWDLKAQTQYNVIYLTSLEKKGEDRQLTRSSNTHFNLRWVPGEERISFKTNREFKDTKPGNLWVLPLNGGEPYPLTNFEKGVLQYAWLDAETVIFTSSETDGLLKKNLKEQKDTTEVVEDEDHPDITRLFKYDLKKEKVTRLTDNVKPLGLISLSPDKKKLVYGLSMSVRYTVNNLIPPKVYLMDLETGDTKEILSEFRISDLPGSFCWEFDSKGFYFSNLYNSHATSRMCGVLKIYYYDLASSSSREVDLGWERGAAGYGRTLSAVPGGVLVQLANGARFKYARYFHKGNVWKREWLKGEEQQNIESVLFSLDGKTLVYEYSTASQPPRYYLADYKGNEFKKKWEILDIKSPLFKKPLAKSEVRTWTGARNDAVEGILYYPYKYEAGKKYPLILVIHGGPFGADTDTFSDRLIRSPHLWCERGTFVLTINYHGSSNYGLDFAESISGHYYEYEIPDIEAGVEMLIKEGKVDEEMMGVIGHSNGAILGTALIVKDQRFKAASLSAGDVNWTSDYGHCSFGVTFDDYYFGGPPWEKTEYYVKISPLFKMQSITTPTLIFHGDKDRSVPYSQGWEFYRALQVIGKAPVRFLSLPGEGHVPTKLAHQRRVQREIIEWFETYLFKTRESKNESLKKGSPLDMLGKMLAIGRSGGLLGVMKNDTLIPEMVEYKELSVGRFEVTRAQWAAFDKGYAYDAGTGNYPVTGISYEKAREYVQWLSALTGETYRLPTEKEAEKLYQKPSGNTFDHWAGYALNPDDYTGLMAELKKYGDRPVLLKPVGEFSPDGKDSEFVFDLGGNAAEWVTVKENEGKPAGGSAVTPEDTKSETKPPLSYTGFRVIK